MTYYHDGGRGCRPQRSRSLEDRFWEKVDRSDEEGCWIWMASLTKAGYGSIAPNNQGGSALAHRVSYELNIGPIPTAMTVDHLCFVPPCVNPDHFRLLTLAENARHKQIMSMEGTLCTKDKHEMTPENTYVRITQYGYKRRQCRACNAEYQQIKRDAKKAAHAVIEGK